MIDQLQHLVHEVFGNIPIGFLGSLLLFFCTGTVLLLALIGMARGTRWSAGLLLFEYMFLLVVSAVLVRKVNTTRLFNFTPFWSYRAIMEGNFSILIQNIGNVVAFVPIGFLLGYAFNRMKWWQVMLVGGGFSLLIEILQFVFKRGFTEFDDVFHNVLGCVIGFEMYILSKWLIRHISPLTATRSK